MPTREDGSDPHVSVVIPTKNRPHMLPRAVESALAQTFEDLEVIVVDDGSDPPVELRRSDSRLRVARNARASGAPGARNTGIDLAAGRFITFLDDDDLLHPDMVEVSLGVASTHGEPAVAALSAIRELDGGGAEVQTLYPLTVACGTKYEFVSVEGRSRRTHNTLFVSIDVLREIGGFDEDFLSGEWGDLFMRLTQRSAIEGVDRVTYDLVGHSGERNSAQWDQIAASAVLFERKYRASLSPEQRGQFLRRAARAHLKSRRRSRALACSGRALRVDPSRASLLRFAVSILGPNLVRDPLG